MNTVPLLPIPLLERTVRHLKITMTPQEHMAFWNQNRKPDEGLYLTPGGKYSSYVDEDEATEEAAKFWQVISEYLVSRCPLCGVPLTVRVDTHDLKRMLDTIGHGEYLYSPCYCDKHFVSIQTFINLNGFIPEELSYYSGKSEVPYIMPIFLPAEPPSYAVMHSLPICRLEDNRFVPRYSLFILTYYSADPDETIRRRLLEIDDQVKGDIHWDVPIMYTWARADKEAWDLPLWVRLGRLRWLDIDRDDLPLKSEPLSGFPYGNIHGMRHDFAYRKGSLEVSDFAIRAWQRRNRRWNKVY